MIDHQTQHSGLTPRPTRRQRLLRWISPRRTRFWFGTVPAFLLPSVLLFLMFWPGLQFAIFSESKIGFGFGLMRSSTSAGHSVADSRMWEFFLLDAGFFELERTTDRQTEGPFFASLDPSPPINPPGFHFNSSPENFTISFQGKEKHIRSKRRIRQLYGGEGENVGLVIESTNISISFGSPSPP